MKNQVNSLMLTGHVKTVPEKSHSLPEETFYTFNLDVKRLSPVIDTLPITISERLLKKFDVYEDDLVTIIGQLRSYNLTHDGASRLKLTVFCKKIDLGGEEFQNEILLSGFVCKPPTYRVTPFGREIADVLLAVNRAYNKSDYIPLIIWGKNAREISEYKVGSLLKVKGRLQAREYEKIIGDKRETRTAFEVSVSHIL